MKNIKFKFKVAANNNTYYATSLKAISSFCKKNGFAIAFYSFPPFTVEKKAATRCGWGVYCIPDNN